MARFKVEISHTVSRTYEVEAESRSDVMDQWYAEYDDMLDAPTGWVLVGESDGEEDCYILRDLDG